MSESRVVRRNRGGGHSYALDGAKVDGVTTLIGEGLAKPALVNWAGNVTAEYAVDHWDELREMSFSRRLDTLKRSRFMDRDLAANRGSQVHALAERIIHGLEVEVPDPLAAHVNSMVRFLDEWRIRPILTETVCFSVTEAYAGTFDAVVTSDFAPGEVWLADWKTSRSGIYGEAALQLAAYRHAEFYVAPDGSDLPMASLGITGNRAVWVRPDGYDVIPLDDSEDTFRFFKLVASVARRSRTILDLRGEALTRPMEMVS